MVIYCDHRPQDLKLNKIKEGNYLVTTKEHLNDQRAFDILYLKDELKSRNEIEKN
jgi:hypothetical protein